MWEWAVVAAWARKTWDAHVNDSPGGRVVPPGPFAGAPGAILGDTAAL